ncbi:MAG: GGDEF domain-containing protein [Coriobacteriales bacterium]|nr:GGDEF domain-containing protein [Coriobacteriales bacterium]
MSTYYDAVCILSWMALLILGVLVHENARIAIKDKKVFYFAFLLIATSQFAEWAGIKLNGQADNMMVLLMAAKCADYILTPAVGGALIAQMKLHNVWSKVIDGTLICNTVFQIVAAFNGWVFYIDSNNCYAKGPLFWAYLALSFLIIILVAIQFVVFGQTQRRHNQVSLYLMMSLVLTALCIQELTPWRARVLYIGITLAASLLFIHVTEFSQLTTDDLLSSQLVRINTDALTGLLSRHAYSDDLNNYNAMKSLPEDFAAISIDVNGLKNVNDSLGHEAGDELIMGAASCIQSALGQFGKCYRTGGDEFIVLARGERTELADAIRRLDDLTKSWHGQKVGELHLAAGCALSQDHPNLMAEKLVNEADMAMYADKAAYYQTSDIDRRGYDMP